MEEEKIKESKQESEEISIDLQGIGTFVKKHKTWFVYGLLLIILILTFMSRTQNIPNLEGKYLVSPDDPYYFLRVSNTVYETGGMPEVDELRYYPDGQETKFENNFMAYLAGYTLRIGQTFFPEADMFDVAAWLSPSLLLIGLIGFFFLFVVSVQPAAGEPDYFQETGYLQESDAEEWAKNLNRDASFGEKRFRHKKEIENFVDKVYYYGAVYIGVVFIMEDPAGLRIQLPINRKKREELFLFLNETLTETGYPSFADRKQILFAK